MFQAYARIKRINSLSQHMVLPHDDKVEAEFLKFLQIH